MHKLVVIVLICLIFLFILIYSVNFYFLSQLKNVRSLENKSISLNSDIGNSNSLLNQIEFFIENVETKQIYQKFSPKYLLVRNKIIKNYQPCDLKTINVSSIWEVANSVNILNNFWCFVHKLSNKWFSLEHEARTVVNSTQILFYNALQCCNLWMNPTILQFNYSSY